MAYSKAKLKRNGNRASPCFKPFLIGNMSDKFLPTWTLSYISVRHIFISLKSFMGKPNSMRILYKTSLLIESQAFLKSEKIWCTALLYSHFFSSIWQMQNIRSVVDLLSQNPHWCFLFLYPKSIKCFTYLLTPWTGVLLEKLTGSQLVKKFPAFYGTQRSITMFTSADNLSLSSARSTQSMPPIPLPEDPS